MCAPQLFEEFNGSVVLPWGFVVLEFANGPMALLCLLSHCLVVGRCGRQAGGQGCVRPGAVGEVPPPVPYRDIVMLAPQIVTRLSFLPAGS